MGAGQSTSYLSCPQDDGTTYTSAGRQFAIQCFNDSMYSDINSQGPITTTIMEDCITDCVNTAGCIDISFIPSKNECYLKYAINSGTYNDLVWGARLLDIDGVSTGTPVTLTTSTSTTSATSTTSTTSATSTSSTTLTSSIPTSSTIATTTTSASFCSNTKVPNGNFASGLAPWVFSGPDTQSHVVTNDSANDSIGSSSYFVFNSTGSNTNSISQRLCGIYDSAPYELIVRYVFVTAETTNASVADSRFYKFDIKLNGTSIQATHLSPDQTENEYTSFIAQFQAESSVYDLELSWGVDPTVAGADSNVLSVLEIGPVSLDEEVDFE